jgi:hypothetical protein
MKAESTPEDEFQLSALEMGIGYEEAVLRWLEKLPRLTEGGKKAGGKKRGS